MRLWTVFLLVVGLAWAHSTNVHAWVSKPVGRPFHSRALPARSQSEVLYLVKVLNTYFGAVSTEQAATGAGWPRSKANAMALRAERQGFLRRQRTASGAIYLIVQTKGAVLGFDEQISNAVGERMLAAALRRRSPEAH